MTARRARSSLREREKKAVKGKRRIQTIKAEANVSSLNFGQEGLLLFILLMECGSGRFLWKGPRIGDVTELRS